MHYAYNSIISVISNKAIILKSVTGGSFVNIKFKLKITEHLEENEMKTLKTKTYPFTC